MDIQLLHELYNGFLASLIACYAFRVSARDLQRCTPLQLWICGGIITLSYPVIDFTLVSSAALMKPLLLALLFFLLNRICLRRNIYHSLLIAIFTNLISGFAEVLLALTFILPLHLSVPAFRSSFFYLTVGNALVFLYTAIILRVSAKPFTSIRRRLLQKNEKLCMILSVNLTAMTILLSILYFLELQFFHQGMWKDAVAPLVLLSLTFCTLMIGMLYLLHYALLHKMEADKVTYKFCFDEMTGTLNRTFGMQFLQKQIDESKRSKQCCTLCYIDINDLKKINDSLGHKEGDRLIRSVVDTAKLYIRESDSIIRLGGDEFAIVFPGMRSTQCERVLQHIKLELSKLRLFSDANFKVSISYGFAELLLGHLDTVEGLLEKADQKMYENKRRFKRSRATLPDTKTGE